MPCDFKEISLNSLKWSPMRKENRSNSSLSYIFDISTNSQGKDPAYEEMHVKRTQKYVFYVRFIYKV